MVPIVLVGLLAWACWAQEPDSLSLHERIMQVNHLFSTGHMQDALKRGVEIVEADAENPHAWFWLGSMARYGGRDSVAVQCFLQSRALKGQDLDGDDLLKTAYLGLKPPGNIPGTVDFWHLPAVDPERFLPMEDSTVFAPGDGWKLSLEASEEVFVFVFLRRADGQLTCIFPGTKAVDFNDLKRFQAHQVQWIPAGAGQVFETVEAGEYEVLIHLSSKFNEELKAWALAPPSRGPGAIIADASIISGHKRDGGGVDWHFNRRFSVAIK